MINRLRFNEPAAQSYLSLHPDSQVAHPADALEIMRDALVALATGSAIGAPWDGLEAGHPDLMGYSLVCYPMRAHENGVIGSEIGPSGMCAVITLKACAAALLSGKERPDGHDMYAQLEAFFVRSGGRHRGLSRGDDLVQFLPSALVVGVFSAFVPGMDVPQVIRDVLRHCGVPPCPERTAFERHGACLAAWAKRAVLAHDFLPYNVDASFRTRAAARVADEFGPLAARAELSLDPVEAVVEQAFAGLQTLLYGGETQRASASRLVHQLGGRTEAAGALFAAMAGLLRTLHPDAHGWAAPTERWGWLQMFPDDRKEVDECWQQLALALLDRDANARHN